MVTESRAQDGCARRAGRQRRRSYPIPCRVPERRASQAHRRRRYSRRRDHRSDGGAEDRAANAAAVAGTGDRGFQRAGWLLRCRFQLRLHEHDFLAHADHAAAHGDQSARGVHPPVRRRRQRRRARCSASRNRAAFWMRSWGRSGIWKATWARATAIACPNIWTRFARSSGAFSSPKNRTPIPTLAVPASPTGIPDDHEEHTKLMFDLMALAFQANITRISTFMMAREVSYRTFPHARHLRRLPSRVAPSEQSGAAGAV